MIKLKLATNGEFYFTVHAENHQVLVTSETYKSRRNALKGMLALADAMGNVKTQSMRTEHVIAFTDETK